MAFDYKKEYKEFYLPKNTPAIVTIPPMNFAAVRGRGDPNLPGGAYQQAIGVLYAVAYTIKMSKMGDHRIEGYFDYVVPPLEGFWQQDGVQGVDYTRKSEFRWISLIRLPEFVTESDFRWAVDDEPATVARMHAYMEAQGYAPDFSDTRLHHEIYLSDPRKAAPEKLKTVIRHPIRKV